MMSRRDGSRDQSMDAFAVGSLLRLPRHPVVFDSFAPFGLDFVRFRVPFRPAALYIRA